MPMPELDVRILEPRDKHPTIFRTFDDLASGEAFILVNDHNPQPLFYQLQAERTGQFEWNYLEAGPEVWKVELRRL